MNYTEKARALRKKQTKTEMIFWHKVRNQQIGLKFVRQKPIRFNYLGTQHAYYADFYCREKKLVVEIDGIIHENQKEYDQFRDYIMKNLGINVIRIKNEEIETDINQVLQKIKSL